MWHAYDQQSAGAGCVHHVGEHPRWRCQMFEHLKRADGVIGAGVVGKMPLQRFVADAFDAAAVRKVRVKTGVVGMRDQMPKLPKSAADVEYTLARFDRTGGHFEFSPDTVLRPDFIRR